MSIFEALGIADQERIHTQMLAWMLSPTGPLDGAQRQALIKRFFRRALSSAEVQQSRAVTELKHIDLVMLSPKGLVGLENKMKARASPGQLIRYKNELLEIAKELQCRRGTGADIFLSFAGERAGAKGWNDRSYDHLLSTLTAIGSRNPYVVDYADYLGRLIGFRNDFLADHRKFPAVFRGSGMSSLTRLRLPSPSSPDVSYRH
jgi:hypothetical protein